MITNSNLNDEVIRSFLERLSKYIPTPTSLFLLGGSALCLIGNQRTTLDVDYVGEDLPPQQTELQKIIHDVATQLNIDIEAVPIARFIPLPNGYESRHLLIAQFETLSVFLFDPRSIALSKVARGFETDYDDILFLLRKKLVSLEAIEQDVESTLPQARHFDIAPIEIRQHLQDIKQLWAKRQLDA